MKINIAIDGPSAAGKSTIAKKLADKLGYIHLDTGAMYRCTAYKVCLNNINTDDEDSICSMLADTDIELTADGRVILDGEDVSRLIRTDEISMAASSISRHGKVRADLVKRQQSMAEKKGFIMDGRDIGTVVLKDAEVKVFMTATPEARALRRYNQDMINGIPAESVAKIAEEIRKRDYQDTHRKESPLCKADDAVEIDTSDLTIDEVTECIYKLAEPFIKGDKS